jgi:cell division protein FtsW (lipid II flippase)
MAIALIIFAFIVRMLISVVKQKNSFGFLLSSAACISLAGQFIIFVLSNIGIIAPTSGILPLISFGGTGFVTNMILVGIVLSVYRRADIVTEIHQNSCNNRLIRIEDGKLIIDLFGFKFSKNTD